MQMPGRNASTGDYRYGFQGQETNNEVTGSESHVAFKYRVHDARLGRFLSLDPLNAKYPHYSPYSFSGNRVVDAVELEGLEPIHYLQVHAMMEISVKHPDAEGLEYFWWNTYYQTFQFVNPMEIVYAFQDHSQQFVEGSMNYAAHSANEQSNFMGDPNSGAYNPQYDMNTIGGRAQNLIEKNTGLANAVSGNLGMVIDAAALAVTGLGTGALLAEFTVTAARFTFIQKLRYRVGRYATYNGKFRSTIANPVDPSRPIKVSANMAIADDGATLNVTGLKVKAKGLNFKDPRFKNVMGPRDFLKLRAEILASAKEGGFTNVYVQYYRLGEGTTAQARSVSMLIDVQSGKVVQSSTTATPSTVIMQDTN
jgi:RHS repeat-associated protein